MAVNSEGAYGTQKRFKKSEKSELKQRKEYFCLDQIRAFWGIFEIISLNLTVSQISFIIVSVKFFYKSHRRQNFFDLPLKVNFL